MYIRKKISTIVSLMRNIWKFLINILEVIEGKSCVISFKSFRLTLYMSAPFRKKQDMETINYSKNVLVKGLILLAAIYQMSTV